MSGLTFYTGTVQASDIAEVLGESVYVELVDDGIGKYEFWGTVGYDSRFTAKVSTTQVEMVVILPEGHDHDEAIPERLYKSTAFNSGYQATWRAYLVSSTPHPDLENVFICRYEITGE